MFITIEVENGMFSCILYVDGKVFQKSMSKWKNVEKATIAAHIWAGQFATRVEVKS